MLAPMSLGPVGVWFLPPFVYNLFILRGSHWVILNRTQEEEHEGSQSILESSF